MKGKIIKVKVVDIVGSHIVQVSEKTAGAQFPATIGRRRNCVELSSGV